MFSVFSVLSRTSWEWRKSCFVHFFCFSLKRLQATFVDNCVYTLIDEPNHKPYEEWAWYNIFYETVHAFFRLWPSPDVFRRNIVSSSTEKQLDQDLQKLEECRFDFIQCGPFAEAVISEWRFPRFAFGLPLVSVLRKCDNLHRDQAFDLTYCDGHHDVSIAAVVCKLISQSYGVHWTVYVSARWSSSSRRIDIRVGSERIYFVVLCITWSGCGLIACWYVGTLSSACSRLRE